MKTTPLNCRQRLKAEGKAYPRSNCASCGSFAPNSKVCDAALEAQPEAPTVAVVIARLTKAERAWLKQLQDVLSACPSNRLGFYTSGDRDVTVYDRRLDPAIETIEGDGFSTFGQAAYKAHAVLGSAVFPANVHAVIG